MCNRKLRSAEVTSPRIRGRTTELVEEEEMAPVFPTTLAICGNLFSKMTATAMGIVITSGWAGLTLSSYAIGFVADRLSLGLALLLLPAMSVVLIAINLVLRPYVKSVSPVSST